jgi:hypothetical protein
MSESLPDNITTSDTLNKLDPCLPDQSAASTSDDADGARARFRLKRIPIVLRIESWILYQSSNECICDDCIAVEIGTSDVKKVTLATKKLALRESRFFTRWRGKCSNCGKSTFVIIARRLTWA